MATTVAKPAWYDDPASRHRLRYWDGAHWTAYVSDLGETSLDELPPGPSVPPLRSGPDRQPPPREGGPYSTTSTVAPPPPQPSAVVPPPPSLQIDQRPSRRRPRGWLIVAIAATAILGLVVGLLAWAPWTPRVPSVPTEVRAGSATAVSVLVSWHASTGGAKVDRYVILRGGIAIATVPGSTTSYRDKGLRPGTSYRYSVAAEHGSRRSNRSVEAVGATIAPSPVRAAARAMSFSSAEVRWSPPPGAPRPDQYVILRDGASAKTVAGSVTSYTDTRLAPGTTFHYRIAAVWAGRRSTPSTAVNVTTPTPPVSLARLQGTWQVDSRVTSSSGGNIPTGMTWSNSWDFTPQCTSGPCSVVVSGVIAPAGFANHDFTATLNRDGAVYTGTTSAHITHCGEEPNVTDVPNQITLRITTTAAQVNGTSWDASRWTGSMTLASPYVQVVGGYCPAQSREISLTATG